MRDKRKFTLVLGGGNALGAYHLGACRCLFERRMRPDRIIGASIGAVAGAILLGNPPDRGIARLQEFWDEAAAPALSLPEFSERRSLWAGLDALLTGRPGLFRGALAQLPMLAVRNDRSLSDHRPLAATLGRMVDFALLERSETELQIATLDIESGDEVWFSNRNSKLTPEHLLAATALAPLYPAIELEGRLLCDVGLANNLPVDRAFALEPASKMLCIAVDLFSVPGSRPESLDGMVERAQDLVFASQSRRSIAAIARDRAYAALGDKGIPPAVLAHVAFRASGEQRGLKALDYSRRSIRDRAEQGARDMAAMLDRVAAASWDRPLLVLERSPEPRLAPAAARGTRW